MQEDRFRFKKFQVSHSHSSMKIGVDAVLLGAWAGVKADKILEIGTGCGVISLMLAQRFPTAKILAIDRDISSIKEAKENFENSIWRDNLDVSLMIFPEDLIDTKNRFDLIVCNPPYYDSGIINPKTPREIARHQESLSVFSLINYGHNLLNDNGKLAMIFPIEFLERVEDNLRQKELYLYRICKIRDNDKSYEKRVMIECGKISGMEVKSQKDTLILHDVIEGKRVPTQSYIDLCKDFYLKF